MHKIRTCNKTYRRIFYNHRVEKTFLYKTQNLKDKGMIRPHMNVKCLHMQHKDKN